MVRVGVDTRLHDVNLAQVAVEGVLLLLLELACYVSVHLLGEGALKGDLVAPLKGQI